MADEGDIREPWVAGRFYPGSASELWRTVDDLLSPREQDSEVGSARVVMAPHAGYVYSGEIAAKVYRQTDVPKHVVVLCPNHTGRGARRSIWAKGAWRLPGRLVAIDEVLAARVADRAGLSSDHAAHRAEHAIEVQLPFLAARRSELRIVPVCLSRLSFAECTEVGRGLASAIRDFGERVLVVASTDMSHYVPAEVARELDGLALDRVLSLDAEGLHEVVRRQRISMCGYVPTTCALIAARELGASRAKLAGYGHSGETTGDDASVVGYAGVTVD